MVKKKNLDKHFINAKAVKPLHGDRFAQAETNMKKQPPKGGEDHTFPSTK